MNLIEFNKILVKPNQIKKDQIKGLHTVIEEYPYFQVAHFLLLKGLKLKHSFKYNDYLKKTAAYTTDRSVLFDNITTGDLDIHPAPADLLEDQKGQNDQKDLASEGEIEPIETTLTIPEPTQEAIPPEETLGIGRPIQFNRDESFSFREWLQLSSFEPIDRSISSKPPEGERKIEVKESAVKDRGQKELINKFIASNPKINPSLQANYNDFAMDSIQENENLMTETLAHVYVEQKKYEKAITAFTILSLKYPEKSSFFALQIEAIKKLQEK